MKRWSLWFTTCVTVEREKFDWKSIYWSIIFPSGDSFTLSKAMNFYRRKRKIQQSKEKNCMMNGFRCLKSILCCCLFSEGYVEENKALKCRRKVWKACWENIRVLSSKEVHCCLARIKIIAVKNSRHVMDETSNR
jgi:hypothetical protein